MEPDTPRREGNTIILNLWSKSGVDWRLFDLFAEQFPALAVEGRVYYEGDAYSYEGRMPVTLVHCHSGQWSARGENEVTH